MDMNSGYRTIGEVATEALDIVRENAALRQELERVRQELNDTRAMHARSGCQECDEALAAEIVRQNPGPEGF